MSYDPAAQVVSAVYNWNEDFTGAEVNGISGAPIEEVLRGYRKISAAVQNLIWSN